jgi:uncharacterized protein YecA (UPF0149 family)
MSQVIVENDVLREKRAQSAVKEHAIDREGEFRKWQMSDITKFDPVFAAVRIAALPIFAVWWLLSQIIRLAIVVASGISFAIGGLLGRMRDPTDPRNELK